MKNPINVIRFIIAYIWFLILYPFGKLYYRKRQIWLFCERGNDAKDNAYYFYRWICKEHPEIDSYFVISTESKDYNKVDSIGKCCKTGSFKHWLLYIASKVRLSTHLYNSSPNKFLSAYFIKYKKRKSLDVFLQHGITYNFQDCFYKKNNKCDLVICGAEPEYHYLMNMFDLGDDCLKYTGFPRFDSLENTKGNEKFILVQPTWRSWLANLKSDDFIKTQYFIEWSRLLANKTLLNLLNKNNIKLYFRMHPSLIKYKTLFKEDDSVKIIDESIDIQKLLCESLFLITDYSSILFDYAYLKKPTLYFQFDNEKFFSNHYKSGYFDIRNDGFGDVVCDIKELVDKITDIIKNNFEINGLYSNRVEKFFCIRDNRNCLNVYNEIVSKINEKYKKSNK